MVKRFLGIFTREIAGLHDAAYLLAFFTVLSQLLALVRDRIFAYQFGAGRVLDIYYASFKIPDLIFVSVASLVSISVLVPFLMERLRGGEDELRKFINPLFSLFLLLIIAISVIAFLLTPMLVRFLFPGVEISGGSEELILLTRIMLLSPILLGISNFFVSITQAFRRFVIYAISPLFYNLGIIIGAGVLYPIFGMSGLAWGVVLGALMHVLVQIPFLKKRGLLPRFYFRLDFHPIKEVFALSVGRTLALSSSNIANIFILTIGSLMSVGSIAVFNLSWNMQSVPLAIVGASYSIALFPTISKFFSEGDRAHFLDSMLSAARHIVFWSLPITVLFIVLRAQIVRTILGSGQFSWSDTRLVAASLAVFSISVVAQSLVLLFVRAYYARGRTKIPLIVNLVSGVAAVGFSYLLWRLFLSCELFRYFIESLLRIADIPGTEVVALPLGYSLSVFLNLALFWYVFHKEEPDFTYPLLKTIFQSFSASVLLGFFSYASLWYFAGIFDQETLLGIFSQGFFAGTIGIIAGIVILRMLKSRELFEVWTTLHHKVWRTKVVVSESDAPLEKL